MLTPTAAGDAPEVLSDCFRHFLPRRIYISSATVGIIVTNLLKVLKTE